MGHLAASAEIEPLMQGLFFVSQLCNQFFVVLKSMINLLVEFTCLILQVWKDLQSIQSHFERIADGLAIH